MTDIATLSIYEKHEWWYLTSNMLYEKLALMVEQIMHGGGSYCWLLCNYMMTKGQVRTYKVDMENIANCSTKNQFLKNMLLTLYI